MVLISSKEITNDVFSASPLKNYKTKYYFCISVVKQMANQYCAFIYSIYQTGGYTRPIENNKDNSTKKATEKKLYGTRYILLYIAGKMLRVSHC